MSRGQQIPNEPDYDVRPLVGTDRGNLPLWIGFVAIGLIAVVLLVVLEGRRQRQLVAPVRANMADDALMRPYQPPALVLPAEPQPMEQERAAPSPQPSSAPAPPVQPPFFAPPTLIAPSPSTAPPLPGQPAAGNAQSGAQAIVYDISAAETPAASVPGAAAAAVSTRADTPAYARQGRASRLTTMVARGTLIPAVLETALDSTQPGQARAVISNDVFNLNGDRVLIARGSRLFGEYRADLAPGQKRAFVQWNQLIRPDGVVIAIESPATDPLGRAGIRGRVNSNFAGRLGGALLQSAIDFGTLAAAQSLSSSSVIIAGPALQGGTSQLVGPAAKPTLSVRQGTKISVMVARDLEFAPVEAVQ